MCDRLCNTSACEWDGGVACARLAAEGLPFSPHGEAYVDGGISDAAPTLRAVMGTHALFQEDVQLEAVQSIFILIL